MTCVELLGRSFACLSRRLLPPLALLFTFLTICTAHSVPGNNHGGRDSCSSVAGAEGGSSGRSAPLPLLDGLFPHQSLDGAWETSPLLSVLAPDADCLADPNGNGSKIPTVAVPCTPNRNRSDCHQQRLSALQSLFSADDIATVLSQPNLRHKEDFQLVSTLRRFGREFEVNLPSESVPPDEALEAFEKRGFSLVINALQRRWGAVGKYARQLQNETGAAYVSANLYLTPDTADRTGKGNVIERRRGFEVHWDWMDVVVVQISGSKMWSVARDPVLYLSTQDMKRKPTSAEMDAYQAQGGRYDEFLLRPGDALYIPRGFIHNASTVDPDLLGLGSGSGSGSGGHSLHLTLGIEHSTETTYEGLVHHALELSDEQYDWYTDDQDGFGRVAIPGADCSLDHDVTWPILLHFVVADVARAGCPSGKEPACQLRRSVSRGLPWEQVAAERRHGREGQSMGENGEDAAPGGRSDHPVQRALLESVAEVVHLGNLQGSAAFAARLLEDEDYYIPTVEMTLGDMRCVVGDASELSPALLQRLIERFHSFVQENYIEIIQRFEKHLAADRSWRWDRDDGDLDSVGQLLLEKETISY